MARKVCDFCLKESSGILSGYEKLADGHYICRDCKSIISSYGLSLKHDLFQTLVTAQSNMKDMIMDTYLDKYSADDTIAKFFPMPAILLHGGEKCINTIPASITVNRYSIPDEDAVSAIVDVSKYTINNLVDVASGEEGEKVDGTLYLTDAAIYFLSKKFVNCHRIGHIKRDATYKNKIVIATPTKTFTYTVKNNELFFLRERFYHKVIAAKHNKSQHLIYMTNDNKITITPGVYDISKNLKAGCYKVKAIKDAGLHIKDPLGRVHDYYENEETIYLDDGGKLECTGEYQLQWIGETMKE